MTFDLFDFEDTMQVSPERALWLAVIERAMLDYCFPTNSLMKKDVSDLPWFFFSNESEKYNLVYICDQLFDSVDIIAKIRTRVKGMKDAPGGKNDFKVHRYRITALCAFQR